MIQNSLLVEKCWLDLIEEFRKWERSWNVYLKQKRRKQPLEATEFILHLRKKYQLTEIDAGKLSTDIDWRRAINDSNIGGIALKGENPLCATETLKNRQNDLYEIFNLCWEKNIFIPLEWIEEHNEYLKKHKNVKALIV